MFGCILGQVARRNLSFCGEQAVLLDLLIVAVDAYANSVALMMKLELGHSAEEYNGMKVNAEGAKHDVIGAMDEMKIHRSQHGC